MRTRGKKKIAADIPQTDKCSDGIFVKKVFTKWPFHITFQVINPELIILHYAVPYLFVQQNATF